MDHIQRHLDTVPIGLVAAFCGFLLIVALVTPKKAGFYIAIFAMFAWINLDRFQAIPYLSSAAKVTYWLPPVLLMFFASFIPGPRRPVPLLAWVYLLAPIFGVVCIAGAQDNLYGVVQFSAMFLYAAAGITLYRVANSRERMVNVAVTIFLGILVPVAVAFSALVLFRGMAFRPGVARFEPFGMISNQYVHFFATACGLGACGFLTLRNPWYKTICVAAIAACGAMLVASGSRQGLIIVILAMLPSIRWGIRKPIIMALGIAAAIVGGVWVFSFTEGVGKTDRLTDFSHASGRWDTAKEYTQILLSRPAGLLGTTGFHVNRDDSATHIPHNSYLKMGYLGGMALAIPLILVWLKTMYDAVYVLLHRDQVDMNETLLMSFAALLLAIYAQGMVNDMIYMSISSWTFLHYFLSCFFMGTAKEIRRNVEVAWQYARLPTAASMG